MKTLVPALGMTSLRRDMDRLLDRFWDGDDFLNAADWNPRMDISETNDSLIAKIDVPGVQPQDIQLTMNEGVLSITGERRKATEEKGEHFFRIERSFGSFVRGLKLPTPVDATKVNATFKDGVLTVVMPKSAEAKGTSIPIKPV
jgi:HSP20 family protein